MTKSAHKATVEAPSNEVFKAITTAEGLKGWYTKEVKGDPSKENGEFTLSFTKHEGPFSWKVVTLKPETEVSWQCTAGPGQSKGTKAIFRLAQKGEGKTAIELEHDGFEDTDEKIKTCNTLWGGLLIHLKEYAEKHQPEPAFN